VGFGAALGVMEDRRERRFVSRKASSARVSRAPAGNRPVVAHGRPRRAPGALWAPPGIGAFLPPAAPCAPPRPKRTGGPLSALSGTLPDTGYWVLRAAPAPLDGPPVP
jgi:hypothetical protein